MTQSSDESVALYSLYNWIAALYDMNEIENNVLLYWGNLRCKQAHTVPGHLTKPMRTPGRGGGVRKT